LASVGSETRIAPSSSQCTPLGVGVSADASWELTRSISPRKTVRVAAVDAYGTPQNLYTGWRSIAHSRPAAPWAVNLADPDGNYRLIGFDLDAKTAGAAEVAADDASRLGAILSELGIEHMVCQSGPTDGRHVWIALSEPVSATTIKELAHIARHSFRSLDISPLTNASTGCLRPPGAPHRFGGGSAVLSGSDSVLLAPTTTAKAIDTLIGKLSALLGTAHDRQERTVGSIHTDAHGRVYIPGQKRPLPVFSASAASEPAALGDASSVLWRVLIGAAAAHWHYDEVAGLVDNMPGLEHVRTLRDRASRTARPLRGPSSPHAVLARQWVKAVQHVASRAGRSGDDPTFDPRAGATADHVQAIQDRARATGGRWIRHGGPADRRVLDALCLLGLRALSTTVEADTRRLALLAGVGRETARTALLRLAAEGWIVQHRAAEGPHGAQWSIAPRPDIHRGMEDSRSQADPRPPGAGAAKRTALLTLLSTRLENATHDVFTLRPGIGHHAGNVYASLTTTPLPASAIASQLGIDTKELLPSLERLRDNGLAVVRGTGWSRPTVDGRDAAAERLSVNGRLHDRAKRYELERELWAWWQAEQTWMHAPRRSDARRRPRPGQVLLVPITETNVFGAHPRREDGRADYRRARAILTDDSPVSARPINPAAIPTRRRLRVA